jgi:hypothetical protein
MRLLTLFRNKRGIVVFGAFPWQGSRSRRGLGLDQLLDFAARHFGISSQN